jgi:hypothetical protein
MQSIEEVKPLLIQAKHVSFASSVEDNTFRDNPVKKPKFSTVRKTWLKRCHAGEYEQLKQDLRLFESRGFSMEEFFSDASDVSESSVILGWSVGTATTIESLQFMCENIVPELIQKTLMQDNYSLIKGLLLTESGMDGIRKPTETELEVRIQKMIYLLSIDFEGVQNFIQENREAPWLSAGMKTDIDTALFRFKQQMHIDNKR